MIGDNEHMNIKRNAKEISMKLLKWIVSNIIWTIITIIVPFSLLIPVVSDICKSIVRKTYNIHLWTLILIIGFIIIETFVVLSIVFFKRKENTNVTITNPNNENTINYEEFEYYFESYHKHLTVYKNGNGILINSFTVVINDINAISEFKREIDITDAKVTTEFPKMNIMKREKLNNRFSNFGFWYKCLNNKDLIKSVTENYWSENSKEIDNVSKSNPKILKWIMEMNPSSIEIGKPYDIVYIMSIPGMFPIENGYFMESIANIKGTNGKFQSRFGVKHAIKNLKYTVSFENGLILNNNPNGNIACNTEKKNLHCSHHNNIIYDKYIFNTTNPKIGSVVNIEWTFKFKKQHRKQKRRNIS